MTQKIDKLAKSKAVLIMDHPFFASLLLSIPMIEDATVKTMETDGAEIRYNPTFLEKMTQPETTFVLAHETLHGVFLHMFRRGARTPNRWNIAADYVINDLLVSEGIGSMPSGCLHDSNLVKQGNGTAEGVYGILPEDSEGKGPGDAGGAMDHVKDAAQDEATNAAKEADMRVRVVQAANAAKMQGKLSEGLERIAKEMTRSRTDWRAVLRRFFTERAKTDWSFARPKRRFMAEDFLLPSLHGEAMGCIVVPIDCSGSITEELLSRFGSEINAIKEDVKPSKVVVIYFDSEVLRCDSFGADEPIQLTPIGGGGTMFSPVFKYIEENALDPMACVFLTDLHCSDFGQCPSYPVLWASIGADKAPFGEVLKIDEE